jgi:integrase
MSKKKRVTQLTNAITRFVEHKRALGHRCRHDGRILHDLRRHVEQRAHRDIDAKSFKSWFSKFDDRHPNTRNAWYQIVRRFCLYRSRSVKPGCFVPSSEAVPKCQPPIAPVIINPEQIARMLAKTSEFPATKITPLRQPALRLAIVLLYTSGLRLGELLRLTMGDAEQDGAVLRIRESKFHKSRLVPLSSSAANELRRYLRKRRKIFSDHPNMPLLCNRHHGQFRAYSPEGMGTMIRQLFGAAKVQDEGGRHPRVHDLRHSFAVQALIRWYRDGADVQTELPKLAIYMGHKSIESTVYYLRWTPTLQRLASNRFERQFGQLVAGGVQ